MHPRSDLDKIPFVDLPWLILNVASVLILFSVQFVSVCVRLLMRQYGVQLILLIGLLWCWYYIIQDVLWVLESLR